MTVEPLEIDLWLPTFGTGAVNEPDRLICDAARLAESLGFGGLWTIDHPLAGAEIHDVSWLEPLTVLSAAAAVTDRIRLGTAILVAGIRHPIWLAKQIATLAVIAGDRVTLGAASGWYDKEYESLGASIRQRRALTDECLEATRQLLEGPSVTFHGTGWSFEDVSIAPRPGWRIPFYIGGGSRLPDAGSENDVAQLSPSVLNRITRYEGWLAPCAGNEQATLDDLAQVQEAVDDPASFGFAHVQWVHLVDTDDRERALDEQIPAFRQTMGSWHSREHLQRTYLTGSMSDIRARLRELHAAGFDHVILGPVVRNLDQIELLGGLLTGITSDGREDRERAS